MDALRLFAIGTTFGRTARADMEIDRISMRTSAPLLIPALILKRSDMCSLL
jgi:hypothetical protein